MKKISTYVVPLICFMLIPAVSLQADIQSLLSGTSGPFTAFEDDANAASFGQFFTFSLDTTTTIDVDINRTTADPDLAATLFLGDITGEDPNLLSPDGLINGLLVGTGTFGPLTAITFEDDTEDDPFGGPFGDPRFTDTLGPGDYTILVAALNAAGDGFQFTITSNVGATAIPEPATAGFCLTVLAAISLRRRR